MAAETGTGGARRPRARRVAALAGALLLGGALVLLLFARPGWDGGPTLTLRLDPGRFVGRLRESRGWAPAFVAVAATQPLLRALVWWALLPRVRLADAYHATALGALVHNVVPGKLGPLAAAWVLARTTGRGLAPALSTQLVAKLLELGAVVALGALASARAGPAVALRGVVATGAALFVLLAAAAAALALGAPRLAAGLARRLPRAAAALAGLGGALAGAARAGRLAPALALAALPAAASGGCYALALHGAGLAGSAAGGPLLVAVITFGQLTPGLPVGAAVTWTLAAWGARQLGATPEAAAALAVVCDAGMIVASLAVGAASAVVRRGDVRALLRGRRALLDVRPLRPGEDRAP
jgi:hypothetical protein